MWPRRIGLKKRMKRELLLPLSQLFGMSSALVAAIFFCF